MRRVPHSPTYAVLGSGRLARHLSFYLSRTNGSHFSWSRNGDQAFNTFSDASSRVRLQKVLKQTDTLLLAISDDSLLNFSEQLYGESMDRHRLIHFSASQDMPYANSLHPLMTFGPTLLPVEQYSGIPFCELDRDRGLFHQVFPKWTNPVFSLSKEKRRKYHAYLVASGNFTALLWKAVEEKFQQELGLDVSLLQPYKKQIFSNIIKNSQTSATGPLVRGDVNTIKNNLDSLAQDDLHDIYQAFANTFVSKGRDV